MANADVKLEVDAGQVAFGFEEDSPEVRVPDEGREPVTPPAR